ncbi:uncharacterized protein K452DRAFT_357885 [Aplosporella prunicola CBS 121167]|uniref:ubiquitinyl hydrolase 1 n=1 Tax=Aplosporella prunicola CBS 121167 TaxID=1176127 RepID=A0A6A6BHI7_9PEZI|nr:uncharacterized protein K452DRAFT_357885 [Aplosporella prunicola CBS 121167]KAF2142805.1 hypothetical protein K452DRAFT_357885 [Aplosporella prunicola CBS 121167]
MSAKYGGEIMEGVSRFLSRKGRRAAGDSKRNANTTKPPPAVSADLYKIFSAEDEKKQDKEEAQKVKAISQRLAALGITSLKESQIQYALRSKTVNGDMKEALEMLVLFQDSLEGILRDYNPNTKLLGAENRESVTCYLDALLFAMFARLDSFEAMLFDSFTDEPRKRLSSVLRLWVNLLRAGKLITTDVTKHLQEALKSCGWEEAAQLAQQDTSEAFTFITGQLELPLLTLKMDIYHTGKEDVADDHRFVNERLLEVAIPEYDPTRTEPIKLEECLEIYFNNRIEVRRHLERRTTLERQGQAQPHLDRLPEKSSAMHVEAVEEGSASSPGGESPAAPSYSAAPTYNSLFSERHIEEGESSDHKHPDGRHGRPRAVSAAKKEITMPAWQFFSLIPWYTDNAPANDAQVAAHFAAKRPILGICLKRYMMMPNGHPKRLNTYIDIPLEIALPHFISDEHMHEEGPLFGNFQLVLQSVVCHRGVSVDSGHYVSLVRGTEPTARSSHGHDPYRSEPDEVSAPWMRFDDLAKDRVTYVDIEQALKEECPYLLFYQVCPIDEELARGNPPTYEEANSEATADDTFLAEKGELIIDNSDNEQRPSFELADSQVLTSGQESAADDRGRSSFNSTRQSIMFDEASLNSRAPTGPSTPADDSKPSFLSSSRRGSKAKKAGSSGGSKSRPTSQSGEGRLSITMSRLTGRRSRDKLNDVLATESAPPSATWPASGGGSTTMVAMANASADADVAGDPANPLVLVDPPGGGGGGGTGSAASSFSKAATSTAAAIGRGKRKEKKRGRSGSVPLDGGEGEGDEKKKDKEKEKEKRKSRRKPPERECALM